jgi:hypothetical protein
LLRLSTDASPLTMLKRKRGRRLRKTNGRTPVAVNQTFARRWQDYKVSKTGLFWSCAGCVVATMIVGFAWGGWVTGGTAGQMATRAAAGARADLAAAVCTSRFVSSPDANTALAALKASDSWKRDDVIEKGGWVTLPGMERPISGAASLCVKQLMDATVPLAGATKTSG